MWPEGLATEWGNWIVTILLVYSVVTFVVHLGLGLIAMAEVHEQQRRQLLADPLHLLEGDLAPGISILLPARDAERTIVDAIHSFMQLEYPALEIVVVNDGSTDETLDRLIAEFELRPSNRTPRASVPHGSVRGVYSSPHYPSLTAIDLVRGGNQARAANFALTYSRHPLVLVADPDTTLERDALIRLALPFFEDGTVAGVTGVVRPANGCIIERGSVTFCGRPASRLARFQVVEYLRGMLSGRLAWGNLDSVFILPGTFGLFSREAVRAVGGFRGGKVGEDLDLCMRLQRHAARSGQRSVVRCLSGAIAWTRVPESLRELARQRSRWHQGLAESLWFNRELLLNGRLAFHHGFAFLFHWFLDLIGPVFEAGGQVALLVLMFKGSLDVPLFIIYFSLFVVGGTIPSLMAIALERSASPRFQSDKDLEGLAHYALLENLGYRQMTALWRLTGLWRAFLGRRVRGEERRRGQAAPADEPEAKEAA